MKRRTFLSTASLLALGTPALAARTSTLTPSQAEGPYYPVTPIPLRNNLLLGDQAGESLQLYGSVLNKDGKPLANTRVEIWQCDKQGYYDHPRAPGHAKFDHKNFAGAGAVVTDEKGGYQFQTLVPVPYTGRPPHIHVKLWDGQHELLTTQLYLQGQTDESFTWFGAGREHLQIQLQAAANGSGQTAHFDFVV